jgi:hypothetical protein
MCIAVNTTWINTGVTPEDIRRVFYRQPCLVCILAKRNKDSKLIWARRPAPLPPPAEPPPTTSSSPLTTFRPDTKSNPPLVPDTTSPKTLETERDDSQWEIGECISYDNVGPISPESIEGYRQFIAFRDIRNKYLFRYPVKTCNEDTFLYHLQRVLRFFTSRGFQPRILRSDYYTPPRQISFMRTTSAATTRAQRLTSNGKTP